MTSSRHLESMITAGRRIPLYLLAICLLLPSAFISAEEEPPANQAPALELTEPWLAMEWTPRSFSIFSRQALAVLDATESEAPARGLTVAYPGAPEYSLRIEDLQARWQPDRVGPQGRLILEGSGIEAPGGTIDVDYTLSIRRRDDSWSVDLTASPLQCPQIRYLAPSEWLEIFGEIQLEGEISPWLEVRRHDAAGGVWNINPGGFDGCRVVSLERLPEADWLPGGELAGLNEDFTFLAGSTENIPVGPATTDYIGLSDLPDYVWAAIYLSEDPGHFTHGGFDAGLIALATQRNLHASAMVAGGSSITQQLVKNLFLTPSRSMERKVQELLLAMAITEVVSAERILELYVNLIEFGDDIFGISAAARHYFDKVAQDLSPLEAAFLAAIKPLPSTGELARSQGHVGGQAQLGATMSAILDSLERMGYIDGEDSILNPNDLIFGLE